jgi:hypothetical protein
MKNGKLFSPGKKNEKKMKTRRTGNYFHQERRTKKIENMKNRKLFSPEKKNDFFFKT